MKLLKLTILIVGVIIMCKCKSSRTLVKQRNCRCHYSDSSLGKEYYDIEFSFCFEPFEGKYVTHKIKLGDQYDANNFAGYANITRNKIQLIRYTNYKEEKFQFQTLIDYNQGIGSKWILKPFGILNTYECTLTKKDDNLYYVKLNKQFPLPSHGVYDFKEMVFHRNKGIIQVSFNSPISGHMINCRF